MRGALRGASPLTLALAAVLVAFVAPAAVLAQHGQVRLSLRAVGQPGSFFDLAMKPGETRSLKVEILNAGQDALAARTYAADVYTIVNGGFGGRLRAEPETGTTTWLNYPAEVIQLPAGATTHRSFTVTVPRDAEPGEFITSLVLENDQPIPGGGAVALDQIVRQAIGVVVTVPGRRSPALAIGEASHKIVAGTSVVAVAVDNPGNVRLKPVVQFTLLDAAGTQVSRATVPMGTFYAHTETFIEVPLAAILLPGTYTVRLALEDAAQGVHAGKTISLIVAVPPSDPVAGAGDQAGLTPVTQGPLQGSLVPDLVIVLLAALALGFAIGCLVLVMRRRRA